MESKTIKQDRIGQKFGRLTIVSRLPNCSSGKRYLCSCDCGIQKSIAYTHLISKRTQSCGCQKRENSSKSNSKDITGKKFGLLTVLSPLKQRMGGSLVWECICDCGKNHKTSSRVLISGSCKSCGCLKKIKGEKHHSWNHLMTEEERKKRKEQRDSPEYKSWRYSIFKRDGFKCVLTQKRGSIEAHHLNSWANNEEKRFEVNNGVTLSPECHSLFHSIYGFGENTEYQFEEFKNRYHYGEFDSILGASSERVGARILVIGDSNIDEFIYTNTLRLCPEGPVPVLDFHHKKSNGGMALNVLANLRSLGANCQIITNDNWLEVKKTRYVDIKTNHLFFRVDSKSKIESIPKEKLDKESLSKYDAIIISDYDKGFLSKEDIKKIAESHPLTFLDTKKTLGEWAKAITFIKINHHEYLLSSKEIKDFNLKDKIIQTIGEKGAEFKGISYPVKQVEVKDLSGAGDTFLAGLVYRYISNKDIADSIKFANECASEVVQKKGVAVYGK